MHRTCNSDDISGLFIFSVLLFYL